MHYKRWFRHGDPLGSGNVPRPVVKPEILDLLQIAGGWWSVVRIADRLEVKRNTVQKCVYDLTCEGVLVRRDLGWPLPAEWKAARSG